MTSPWAEDEIAVAAAPSAPFMPSSPAAPAVPTASSRLNHELPHPQHERQRPKSLSHWARPKQEQLARLPFHPLRRRALLAQLSLPARQGHDAVDDGSER